MDLVLTGTLTKELLNSNVASLQYLNRKIFTQQVYLNYRSCSCRPIRVQCSVLRVFNALLEIHFKLKKTTKKNYVILILISTYHVTFGTISSSHFLTKMQEFKIVFIEYFHKFSVEPICTGQLFCKWSEVCRQPSPRKTFFLRWPFLKPQSSGLVTYNVSLSEPISAPFSRYHLSAPSLLCLSLREHSYHCASGPAGNLDCDGGSRGLHLQTEAKVSK